MVTFSQKVALKLIETKALSHRNQATFYEKPGLKLDRTTK